VAGRLTKASRLLNVAGAGLLALGRGRRPVAAAGGAMVMAAALCTRYAVFEAGMASARDPKYTVVPQRTRLEQGLGHRQGEQVERTPAN
jgi:hypothetical protein